MQPQLLEYTPPEVACPSVDGVGIAAAVLVEGEKEGKADAHGKEDAKHPRPGRPLLLPGNAAVDKNQNEGEANGIGCGEQHLRQRVQHRGRQALAQPQMENHVAKAREEERQDALPGRLRGARGP